MTPHRNSNVPDQGDRRIPSPGSHLGGGAARTPGRDVRLLVVLIGAGALWAWSRQRPAPKSKRRPDMPTLAGGRGLHVERTVTVQQSPDEVYHAWRDLESLPRLLPG